MSRGGMTVVSSEEPQTFKRAVQKIKRTALVANLARSWQGWANEHTGKQEAIPSGWMPASVEEDNKKEHDYVVKLTVTPRVFAADTSDNTGSKIRTGSITKTVQPKRSECSSNDVVNAIRGKMESGPEESKPFLDNMSPTRRRQMRALHSAGRGEIIKDRKLILQEKKLLPGSGSVEAENSSWEEDLGLSDNEPKTEQGDTQSKKEINRPKVEYYSQINKKHV